MITIKSHNVRPVPKECIQKSMLSAPLNGVSNLKEAKIYMSPPKPIQKAIPNDIMCPQISAPTVPESKFARTSQC